MADRRIFRLGQSGAGSNLLGPNQGSTPDIFRGEQKPDNSDVFRLTAAGGGARIYEGGPVLSVFGRVGAVVAIPGDYRANQVTNAVDQTQFYADPSWLTSLAWAKITGAPTSLPPSPHTHDAAAIVSGLINPARLGSGSPDASVYLRGDGAWMPVVGGVSSVFGRSGAVVALAGDYTAAMVTNAVSTLGSYADPSWLTSLAWAKITGTPGTFPPSLHTHDAAAIVSGQLATARLGSGSADASVYLRGDGTWAPVAGGVSSVFARTGAVVAAAGDYTAAQVTNAVSTLGAYADPAWITSLAWSKITGAPAAGVSSVFSRSGAVVAVSGDYTVAQVTGAVPFTRTLTTGTGLTGGGDLSVDRTFAVVDDTTTQRQRYSRDASFIAARRELNVITGANVTLTMADDAANNRVNLTIAAAAGGSSGMTDPTTTLGDLIVRGSAATLRLGVGTNGQVLTADSAQALGVKWATPTAGGVTSVFTRSGAVVAATGDYTAAMVTNAADTTGSYANPAWITSLAWAKITGAPTIPSQTPWTSNIDGGGFQLANVGKIGINIATPTYTLDARTGVDHRLMLRTPFGGQDGVTLMSGNDGDTLFKTLTLEASNVLLNVTSGGSVGIGPVLVPNSALHVASSGYQLRLYYGATAQNLLIYRTAGASFLQSQTDAVGYDPLILQPSAGNVGIGISNPIQGKLSIAATNASWPAGSADSQSTAGLALVGTGANTRLLIGLGDAAHNYSAYIQSTYDNGAGNNGFEPLALQPMGGNVGIGTISPISLLHVLATVGNPSLAADCGMVNFGVTGMTTLSIGQQGQAPYGPWLQAKHSSNTGTAYPLCLNPSGGNVGIATLNPAYALDVNGIIACNLYVRCPQKGNVFGAAGGGLVALNSSDANIILYWAAASNWAGIGTDTNGNIWFRTGTSGTPDARVIIGNAGGLGVGINPTSYTLQLATDSAGKPGTNTWAVVSDARTKRNLRPFTEGLKTLLRLKPTSYEYNGEAGTPAGLAGVGLVAQEAADVIPACVRWIRGKIGGQETDVMSLNTGDLAFMFLNAFRELDARVKQLEGEQA